MPTTTTKMPALRPAAVARVATVVDRPATVTGATGLAATTSAMAVSGTSFEWHRGRADVCGNPATIKRLDPGLLGATT